MMPILNILHHTRRYHVQKLLSMGFYNVQYHHPGLWSKDTYAKIQGKRADVDIDTTSFERDGNYIETYVEGVNIVLTD